MNHGTRPERLKRKDYDYIRSYHPDIYYGAAAPSFPPAYLTDDTNWFPNQNQEDEPEGCTNYTSANLAKIQGVSATPQQLEAVTHANALGGYGVLASIDAARKSLNWFGWRFTIQAKGKLDYYDAFRLAQISGLPEKRAISWGTPWFPSWELAASKGHAILAMPTDDELSAIRKDINAFSWHNHCLDGWTTIDGRSVYRDKSWQGPGIDYLYFPREVVNVVNDLYGTIAVTTTSVEPPNIVRVPLPDWFWSFIHSLFGLAY